MDEDDAIVYRFVEAGGQDADLVLSSGERKRLRNHAHGSQNIAVFVVRETSPEHYLFITPYAELSSRERFAAIGLPTGGYARLTLERYAKFLEDVVNGRPGEYEARIVTP